MKYILLIICYFIISCSQKTENKIPQNILSEISQNILEDVFNREFYTLDYLITKNLVNHLRKGTITPYMIDWNLVNKFPLYTNFVENYINLNINNDGLLYEIEQAKAFSIKLHHLKQHSNFSCIREELDNEVLIIIENKDKNDKKRNFPCNVYTNDDICGLSLDLLRFYNYAISMTGEKNIYNTPKYRIYTPLFFPDLESDKELFSRMKKNSYFNHTRLKDTVSILEKELNEKAFPYIFRIKFSNNVITKCDVKKLKEYIKLNPDELDAKYIYAVYELKTSLLDGDKERWISAVKNIICLHNNFGCQDAQKIVNCISSNALIYSVL